MDVSALHVAASGLAANAAKAAVSAYNIVNANTDEFKKNRATIESNETGGPEARINKSNTPGPIVSNPEGLPEEEQYRELSNVDLAEEFVRMGAAENGYRANVSIVRVQDEMIGTILDIIV